MDGVWKFLIWVRVTAVVAVEGVVVRTRSAMSVVSLVILPVNVVYVLVRVAAKEVLALDVVQVQVMIGGMVKVADMFC